MHIDPDVLLEKPVATVDRWRAFSDAWAAFRNYRSHQTPPVE